MTLEEFKSLPPETWLYTKNDYDFLLFKTTASHVQVDSCGKMCCTLWLNTSFLPLNDSFRYGVSGGFVIAKGFLHIDNDGVYISDMTIGAGISRVLVNGGTLFTHNNGDALNGLFEDMCDINKKYQQERSRLFNELEKLMDFQDSPKVIDADDRFANRLKIEVN